MSSDLTGRGLRGPRARALRVVVKDSHGDGLAAIIVKFGSGGGVRIIRKKVMKFVIARSDHMPGKDEFVLYPSDWDDWFQYATLFNVWYYDRLGEAHYIGGVKIGEFGLLGASAGSPKAEGHRSPTLQRKFSRLSESHFSIGQDSSYYENLTAFGDEFREEFLLAMRDIALDSSLLQRAQLEEVTRVSLLREVPLATVKDQFHRLARGGDRLESYKFAFRMGVRTDNPVIVNFSVKPNSTPPSNIQVLIGRNGVGKSTLLNNLAKSLVKKSKSKSEQSKNDQVPIWEQLSNIVSVSFSAFDNFEPITVSRDRTKGLTHHYVGLKKIGSKSEDLDSIKDPRTIPAEMTRSARVCLIGARRSRWLDALRLLEADPIFAEMGISELINDMDDDDRLIAELGGIFRELSSGHKIVLLSVTRLVETVEEKSLVLLDEPEAHLHPPLLSAYVRALSNLLTNRNGMAIIATHSPVVLQEVPKSCVWKLHRSGSRVTAKRPRLETFGENVGTLTDEVFGLEVTSTGFHKMLADASDEFGDYGAALESFGNQLGAEGRAILRSMIDTPRGEDVEG